MASADGRKLSEIERHLADRALAAYMLGRCACGYAIDGEARQVIERVRVHRELEHPKLRRGPRRHVPHVKHIRQPALSEEEAADIARDVARRKRLHGIEEEVAA